MSNDNIIKAVRLKLGRKEVELTVEEAKKLKEALDNLFGRRVIEYVPYDPYPWYWRPLWYSGTTNIECTRYTTTLDNGYQVDCSYTGSDGQMTLKVE